MTTFIVKRDKKEIKRFEHQESDLKVFGYMLSCQPNSVHHALKYEGYEVVYVDETTGKSEFWGLL